MPIKLNLKMYQGSTFTEVLRWEKPIKVYKTITGITKAAPVVITAAGHGLTEGWRFKVSNVLGMLDINSSEEYYVATDITANTLSINSVNTLGYKDYISGGVIEYNQPVSLTGYTARMQIRPALDSSTIIDEYTSLNGTIQLDIVNNAITIIVDPVSTSEYTFTSAVYSLELVSATGVVTTLTSGTITLIKEVTR